MAYAQVQFQEDTSSSSGRSIDDGALYTVQERLATFKVPHCQWPFDSGPCTCLKMAEAGFYFCGTSASPDWVRCVVCHKNMEGWEENDEPLAEHHRHSPKCPFLKLKDPYHVSVGDMIELEHAALDFYIEVEAESLEERLKAVMAGMRAELVKAAEAKAAQRGKD